jgi:hypothetical protein
VERTVDGDDISLSEHVLEFLNSAAADLLGSFGGELLVIEVEEFLAVEGYETSQDTFTDTSDTDGGNNLALDIERVFCNLSDIPLTSCNLLMSWDKVADESEHGENDMFSDRDDIGSSDFSDEEFLLVGSCQIDVVGSCRLELPMKWGYTDTGGDASLQFLCLLNTFPVDVSRVEGSGDDNFGIDNFFVEGGVLAFLVVGDNVCVTLGFEPFSDSELILNCSEQSRF